MPNIFSSVLNFMDHLDESLLDEPGIQLCTIACRLEDSLEIIDPAEEILGADRLEDDQPVRWAQGTHTGADIAIWMRSEGRGLEIATCGRLSRCERDQRVLKTQHAVGDPLFTLAVHLRAGCTELIAVFEAVPDRVAVGAAVVFLLEAVGVE